MILKKVELKKFRNFETLNVSLSEGINFFIGSNGSGKTNFLEGISVLSQLRSFRTNEDKDLIKWGEKGFYIRAEDNDSISYEFGSYIEDLNLRKRAKIDGIQIKKISEFYSKVLTVSYCPDDAFIISGNPDLRRRYFDSVMSKIDKSYICHLSDYKRIIFSRNKVLKEIRDGLKSENDLDIWDEILAEKSVKIVNSRSEFIDSFKSYFFESYNSISDKGDSPDLKYCPNITSLIIEEHIDHLRKLRKKDIIIGASTHGPHRDDFIFFNNNISFKSFASQGQKRTAAIALKNAEKIYIENRTGVKSILLVDDVFSELDERRKINLIETLCQGNQVLFTAVDVERSILEKFKNINVTNVENGVFVVKNEI
jgi:DNA replication and repair protein RecF